MNDELLFEAMSGLDDAYIVSAARSLGYYGLDSVPARSRAGRCAALSRP